MVAHGPAYGNNVPMPLLLLLWGHARLQVCMHMQCHGTCTARCTRSTLTAPGVFANTRVWSACPLPISLHWGNRGREFCGEVPVPLTLWHHPFWLWCSGLEESGAPRRGGRRASA